MRFFDHRLAGSTRDMVLVLEEDIKNGILEKGRKVNCFTLLCDEEQEQLVKFINYVNPDTNKPATK